MRSCRLSRYWSLLVFLVTVAEAGAGSLPDDPLESVMWQSIAERFFTGEIVFDQRVRVLLPASAEDQFQVPVTVDATALEDVQEIVAVADLNPIPLILRYRPVAAAAYVGFRIKLQQASPVRVGVRTADGLWHVNGGIVDAAGGGCTAPAMAHGVDNWMDTLGETRAVVGFESPQLARLRMHVKHPMDTGLAEGIPVFYLHRLAVTDDQGELLSEFELFEPVSEDPALTIKPRLPGGDLHAFDINARDTEGNEFGVRLSFSVSGSMDPALQPTEAQQ